MKIKNIGDYKPYPGFYDLRDFKLTITVFRKLWNIQRYLHYVETNKQYFKKYEPVQWEDVKELSANYQQILFDCEH